ncbi:trans-aconitate 2-methyltransferase [Yersinia ruckeri]|uniref:trans-aconitate 2-methyltransferase n=1 Tax=Yersinia ruckeri TaxID=29486 RepID=UPI0005EA82A8|nr:trans-aconitate 2-methyltransferase [Yersinia ruckeri]AKA39729.1 trans-aconitate methyltransferase [Yersinia ruckeri]MCW6650938.1 trans-aconitate 2-methyltransferase [Yersinia ruckeri]
MSDWEPDLYRQFEAERTRPAADLLARVTLDNHLFISDLGCGPGNSTELLWQRFSTGNLVGIDNSQTMLDSAQKRLPGCQFQLGDIQHWQPPQPQDLIYANASLQWLPEHKHLMPQLLAQLAPQGILAVQMPDNRDEPSHRAMREVATEGPWQSLLATSHAEQVKILSVREYYNLLAPLAQRVDIWRTFYYHPMPSAEAIVNWLRATGLRPFLDPLDDIQRQAFLQAYLRKIDAAYRIQSDGRRLLAFPRLFIVAQVGR